MRAHRRDSSTWRTPSPIPAPRRLGIVRRCPRLWFPISCRGLANQRKVFASQDRISSGRRTALCTLWLCHPEHVSSLPQGCLHQPLRQGWSRTDEVFSNDRFRFDAKPLRNPFHPCQDTPEVMSSTQVAAAAVADTPGQRCPIVFKNHRVYRVTNRVSTNGNIVGGSRAPLGVIHSIHLPIPSGGELL